MRVYVYACLDLCLQVFVEMCMFACMSVHTCMRLCTLTCRKNLRVDTGQCLMHIRKTVLHLKDVLFHINYNYFNNSII